MGKKEAKSTQLFTTAALYKYPMLSLFRCCYGQKDASVDMLSSNTCPKSDLNTTGTDLEVLIYSYSELEVATNYFHPSGRIGSRYSGSLFYGKLRQGHEVAIRLYEEKSQAQVWQFKNELQILTRLRHENLVSLYGYTSLQNREQLLLVYEFICNGTVAHHLHGYNREINGGGGLLSWPIRLRIAIETARALAYLHASNVVHRDLKSDSIYLDHNFRVKVSDFCISRIFASNVTHVSTNPQGTPGYIDPDYFNYYHLSYKSDVYSFGVFLIELVSSMHPTHVFRCKGISLADLAVKKIRSNALNELVDTSLGFNSNILVKRMILSVTKLAVRCLRLERELRPSMDIVLEVLQGIESENQEAGSEANRYKGK